MLYFQNHFLDFELFSFLKNMGITVPFSLSTLRKDRANFNRKNSIKIPFRKFSGRYFYCPADILKFIEDFPIGPASSPSNIDANTQTFNRGRPKKVEAIAALKLGISVRELRLKKSAVLSEGDQNENK